MSPVKLFGTDGVRGLANSDEMNTELAVSLGRAAAYILKKKDGKPHIVIGKDTRLSGYMIENGLASGITSMGVDVVRTGPLPAPGVSFICRSMRADMGIIISASHNPSEHNGIKFFGADGFKLSSENEKEIEKLISQHIPEQHLAHPNEIGRMQQIDDASGRYVQHLKERFPHRLTLNGLKIALDTANGAAYQVAPHVFTELGANLSVINNWPDGLNVNAQCGALYPEVVKKLVMEQHADIGITLDGDADRVILVDENGSVVDGDGILYISAKHLHSKGHLGSSTVVGTVMTNFGLEEALKKEGIALIRTDVGDHNVIAYMHEHGINLGGEPCGHIIYMHHGHTGDGVLAALRILSIMEQTGKKLSQLSNGYHSYPQKIINVPVLEKKPFDQVLEIMKTKKLVDAKLGNKGRILLRYSGTEMMARVMVESNDEKLTDELVNELAKIVQTNLG